MRASGGGVLVSGSADEGMAEVVVAAAREQDLSLSLTVLDRCRTPLLLNERFGADDGMSLACIHADMREFQTDRLSDVIVSHEFVGQFPEEQRPQLFRRWHAALKPGGRVITIFRFGPRPSRHPLSQENAEALAIAVKQRIIGLPEPAALDPDLVVDEVLRYASQPGGMHRIESVEEVTVPLERAGFAIEHSKPGHSPARTTIVARGTPLGRDHWEIVAVRL
jgi:hypothetical protein